MYRYTQRIILLPHQTRWLIVPIRRVPSRRGTGRRCVEYAALAVQGLWPIQRQGSRRGLQVAETDNRRLLAGSVAPGSRSVPLTVWVVGHSKGELQAGVGGRLAGWDYPKHCFHTPAHAVNAFLSAAAPKFRWVLQHPADGGKRVTQQMSQNGQPKQQDCVDF